MSKFLKSKPTTDSRAAAAVAAVSEEKTKRLNVDLSETEYIKLKQLALVKKTSVSALMRELIASL
jgi:predicted small integral membrane protein